MCEACIVPHSVFVPFLVCKSYTAFFASFSVWTQFMPLLHTTFWVLSSEICDFWTHWRQGHSRSLDTYLPFGIMWLLCYCFPSYLNHFTAWLLLTVLKLSMRQKFTAAKNTWCSSSARRLPPFTLIIRVLVWHCSNMCVVSHSAVWLCPCHSHCVCLFTTNAPLSDTRQVQSRRGYIPVQWHCGVCICVCHSSLLGPMWPCWLW